MDSKLFHLMVEILIVEHGKYSNGEPYYSLGFKIGQLAYISDCSAIGDKSRDLIKGSKIIVLDALRRILN